MTSGTFSCAAFQDFAQVRLHIVVWPARPDEREGITLRLHCESGTVVVQPLAVGLPGEFSLPRPGTYDGRVRWQQREEVADLTQEVMREAAEQDLPTDEIAEQMAASAGREQYDLDLWFSRTRSTPTRHVAERILCNPHSTASAG